MDAPKPHQMRFFREAGTGPGVVCLHSNASTSAQWRSLMDQLSPQFHVLAPDLLGAGKGPVWPPNQAVSLGDEVRLLETVFARAGDPFVLVGHSYGAAAALMAALACPRRVRAMVLYEPTLFSLLEQEAPGGEAVDGVRQAAARAAEAIDAGDTAIARGGSLITGWGRAAGTRCRRRGRGRWPLPWSTPVVGPVPCSQIPHR